jgi:hypothetical protein
MHQQASSSGWLLAATGKTRRLVRSGGRNKYGSYSLVSQKSLAERPNCCSSSSAAAREPRTALDALIAPCMPDPSRIGSNMRTTLSVVSTLP